MKKSVQRFTKLVINRRTILVPMSILNVAYFMLSSDLPFNVGSNLMKFNLYTMLGIGGYTLYRKIETALKPLLNRIMPSFTQGKNDDEVVDANLLDNTALANQLIELMRHARTQSAHNNASNNNPGTDSTSTTTNTVNLTPTTSVTTTTTTTTNASANSPSLIQDQGLSLSRSPALTVKMPIPSRKREREAQDLPKTNMVQPDPKRLRVDKCEKSSVVTVIVKTADKHFILDLLKDTVDKSVVNTYGKEVLADLENGKLDLLDINLLVSENLVQNVSEKVKSKNEPDYYELRSYLQGDQKEKSDTRFLLGNAVKNILDETSPNRQLRVFKGKANEIQSAETKDYKLLLNPELEKAKRRVQR